MPRKPKAQRIAEQRARQQKVRDDAREKRRPSRDDIARMLLWQLIITAQSRRKGRLILDRLRDEVVAGLERQGFDVRESETVFEDLTRKYTDGLFPFRPKRHLQPE